MLPLLCDVITLPLIISFYNDSSLCAIRTRRYTMGDYNNNSSNGIRKQACLKNSGVSEYPERTSCHPMRDAKLHPSDWSHVNDWFIEKREDPFVSYCLKAQLYSKNSI